MRIRHGKKNEETIRQIREVGAPLYKIGNYYPAENKNENTTQLMDLLLEVHQMKLVT